MKLDAGQVAVISLKKYPQKADHLQKPYSGFIGPSQWDNGKCRKLVEDTIKNISISLQTVYVP